MSDITLTVSAPGPTVDLAVVAGTSVTLTVSEGGGVSDHAGLPDLATSGHPASIIANTPAGSVAATTVQAAINELDSEKAAKASNLSDLASASTARTNLGLGGAATLSVGTSAGTVAAGDDSRITGALSASTAASTYQPLDADLTAVAALTSPATTITGAVQKSLVDAAGDLLVGTAADTVGRLAMGTAGQALAAGSSALGWVDPLIRTRSKYWHENFVLNTPSGTAWPIINRAYFAPWWLPSGTVLTAIAVNVTSGGTAGNVVRLAVYSNSSFRPATVLAQGTVAGDSIGVKTLTFASPITVTGGWFWVAGCPQGATSPGSTWLSSIQIAGHKLIPTEENGAAWAANYVGSSGAAWYQALSGDFADSPSLTVEAQARNPYLALRVQ